MQIAIQTKASKWNNRQPQNTEYTADLVVGKSITIYKSGVEGTTFQLGDTAEYDSWNLSYTGRITKIGPKTVQITAYPGTQNERKYNLNLYKFCYRNWNFNAEETLRRNQEISYYL